MKDRTKKLIKIGGLAAALALIGGTFAFTNIGQSVLNITEDTNRPQYGARVHDYFDDTIEYNEINPENSLIPNKDVFFENYGQDPVFVRIRLTELFMRNGVPLDSAGNTDTDIDPEAPETWPVMHLGYDGNGQLTGGRDGNHFLNQYFRVNLGQQDYGHAGEIPWFMPTFNLDVDSEETAAAGSARDGEIGSATHPGEGTANYWQGGMTATMAEWDLASLGHSTEEHSARQVLQQDRAPVSLVYWQEELASEPAGVGKYWIVDTEGGWAYWADFLNGATPGNADGGEATSFLIDSKAPVFGNATQGLNSIRYDWTYKLNVFGEFMPAIQDNIQGFVDPDWGEDEQGQPNPDPTPDNAGGRIILEAIWNYHNTNS
ncbi:hypothetical protein [Lactococcus petauri]|uniref:hypothetical protein n=1 Tax=Lactococcus petauri TaxID=1940789 RepID=UPI0018AB6796|nr:hypothetical protein [Lactococcus petauri]MDC0825530.1 hypothetical protein [Lactococcus petauri]